MSITVIVDLFIKPEHADAYCTRLSNAFAETKAQSGFEHIAAYRDEDRPSHIVVIERWTTRADYERYIEWRRDQGIFERLATISEAPMTVRFLRQVA